MATARAQSGAEQTLQEREWAATDLQKIVGKIAKADARTLIGVFIKARAIHAAQRADGCTSINALMVAGGPDLVETPRWRPCGGRDMSAATPAAFRNGLH